MLTHTIVVISLLSFSFVRADPQQTCLVNCFAANPGSFSLPEDCCGCCPEESSCFGNRIAPLCCPNTQQFCGCLSSRAFCEGRIFNSTESVPPFGTCYTPSASQGVCCYFPSPNEWMICPNGTTCCGGIRSGPGSITCCQSNEVCSTDSAGFPQCRPPSSFSCSGQVYDPNTHRCINGVLCARFNGVCKGNVCYDPQQATCFPQRCAGALQGNPSDDMLCGRGLVACGFICIDPNGYFCQNGTVQQKPQQGQPCGNTTCTGNQQCCQSNQPDFPYAQCYNPLIESCARDPRGFGALSTRVCPLSAFGKAQGACLLKTDNSLECFDIDTQFCCQGSSPGGTSSIIVNISDQSICGRNNPCTA